VKINALLVLCWARLMDSQRVIKNMTRPFQQRLDLGALWNPERGSSDLLVEWYWSFPGLLFVGRFLLLIGICNEGIRLVAARSLWAGGRWDW
jgi:hypothetical protein